MGSLGYRLTQSIHTGQSLQLRPPLQPVHVYLQLPELVQPPGQPDYVKQNPLKGLWM